VFFLALLGLFYPAACFGVAAAIAAFRLYRDRRLPQSVPESGDSEAFAHVLPVVAVTAVSWPGIVRPLLDGDSLGYHLPNAASWANAHSLWTTATIYWWYPPGSELFASALFLIGGPAVLGIAGLAALLLLALRVEAFARRAGLSTWSAGAVAAMVVTVPTIGLQGGSLQNDVWLGAWTLECLWALTYDRSAFARSLSICAIVKPVGFVFSAFVLIFGLSLRRTHLHTPARIWLTALEASSMLAIWVIHVAILWPNAIISPVQDAYPNLGSSLVVAHGVQGALTFARALIAHAPGTVVLFATVVAALFVGTNPARRHLPWIFTAVFLIEPFGFDNGDPQLATGASLRFLIPAFVAGVAGSLDGGKRWSSLIGVVAAAIAIVQVHKFVDIFWNDANAHGMLLVATAVGVIILLRSKMPAPFVSALVCALLVYGIQIDNYPVRYYDASLGSNAAPSRLFDWLVRNGPQRIVTVHLGSGAISAVLPHAFVANATDDPCSEAAHLKAVLVVAGPSYRDCGPKLFEDASATVYAAGGAGSLRESESGRAQESTTALERRAVSPDGTLTLVECRREDDYQPAIRDLALAQA